MNYREYESLLARQGWKITSFSPLNIEHPIDGNAQGYAAELVIESLLDVYLDDYELLQFQIAKNIEYFEEGFKTPVSCFLVLHDSQFGGNQLLELAKDNYVFTLSNATILDSNPAPTFTRLNLHENNFDDEEN